MFLSADSVADELGSCVGVGAPDYSVRDAIAYGWACVQLSGYKSGVTRDNVADLLSHSTVAAIRGEIAPLLTDAYPAAERIISTLTDRFTEPSGYQANVRALLIVPRV